MKQINLNELTLNNRGKWPLPIKAGVIIGVCVLIFSTAYWLCIRASFEKLNALRIQEQILKKDFETKQQNVSDIAAHRKQVNLLNHRFRTLLQQFSVKNEMPDLLKEISKRGTVSGLKFKLFAPQSEAVGDFYVELPIKMSVSGTYFQLALFLSHLAQMNRIITLHEFTVKGVSSMEKHAVSEEVLLMAVTVKIYSYQEPVTTHRPGPDIPQFVGG